MAKVRVLVKLIQTHTQILEIDTNDIPKHITKENLDNEDIIEHAVDIASDYEFGFSGEEYIGQVIDYID